MIAVQVIVIQVGADQPFAYLGHDPGAGGHKGLMAGIVAVAHMGLALKMADGPHQEVLVMAVLKGHLNTQLARFLHDPLHSGNAHAKVGIRNGFHMDNGHRDPHFCKISQIPQDHFRVSVTLRHRRPGLLTAGDGGMGVLVHKAQAVRQSFQFLQPRQVIGKEPAAVDSLKAGLCSQRQKFLVVNTLKAVKTNISHGLRLPFFFYHKAKPTRRQASSFVVSRF